MSPLIRIETFCALKRRLWLGWGMSKQGVRHLKDALCVESQTEWDRLSGGRKRQRGRE